METKTKYEITKDQKTGDTIILKHQFKLLNHQVIHDTLFPVFVASRKCKKYDLAGQLLKGG